MTREEAIKVVRNIYQTDAEKEALETLIPELKESEDERTMKELIFFLKEEIPQCSIKEHADKLKEFVSYLEKQKPRWEINNPHTTKWTKEMIDEKFEELVEEYHKQKPAEWSEEDEEHINSVFSDFKQNVIPDEEDQKWLKNRLKSLSPSWKPSEEQMKALQNAVALTACDKELVRLYDELKKL